MNLNEREAFKAMYSFLVEFYYENKDRENAFLDLISNMQVFPFAKFPIDRSIWSAWEKAIKKAKDNEVDIVLRFRPENLEKRRKELNLPDDTDPDQF